MKPIELTETFYSADKHIKATNHGRFYLLVTAYQSLADELRTYPVIIDQEPDKDKDHWIFSVSPSLWPDLVEAFGFSPDTFLKDMAADKADFEKELAALKNSGGPVSVET